jgi:hypothetical protein
MPTPTDESNDRLPFTRAVVFLRLHTYVPTLVGIQTPRTIYRERIHPWLERRSSFLSFGTLSTVIHCYLLLLLLLLHLYHPHHHEGTTFVPAETKGGGSTVVLLLFRRRRRRFFRHPSHRVVWSAPQQSQRLRSQPQEKSQPPQDQNVEWSGPR